MKLKSLRNEDSVRRRTRRTMTTTNHVTIVASTTNHKVINIMTTVGFIALRHCKNCSKRMSKLTNKIDKVIRRRR
ncbi:MAG: hypothetical protein WB443_08515 [Nitrososphaeraceae archaeon]